MLPHARRRALFAVAALPICASAASGQICPDPETVTAGLAEPLASVRFLADNALQGRRAGSPGERCTADYIAERLRTLGLTGAGMEGGFFQDVPLPAASDQSPHAADPHATATGRNVLALLEGSAADVRGEIVVIGAHCDHPGLGGAGAAVDRCVHYVCRPDEHES